RPRPGSRRWKDAGPTPAAPAALPGLPAAAPTRAASPRQPRCKPAGRAAISSLDRGPRARLDRRLAAVLAADIAGYSRLMEEDEERTLGALQQWRHEIAEPRIGLYRGRIIKSTGDGFLVEFASVVDAVRCAVEMQ